MLETSQLDYSIKQFSAVGVRRNSDTRTQDSDSSYQFDESCIVSAVELQ